MKLTVPEALKALLVDDWEAVTKNSQVSAHCPWFASVAYGVRLDKWITIAHSLTTESHGR